MAGDCSLVLPVLCTCSERKLVFQFVGDNEIWSDETFLITHVKPFTHYGIFVSTYIIKDGIDASSGIEGAESDLVYVLTPEDYPDPPRDIVIDKLKYSSVNISWTPPFHPNGK